MKKFILVYLLILISFHISAQDPRDNVIGNYTVQKQLDGTGTIWWDTLVITKDLSDTSQINIVYKDDGGSGHYYIYNSVNDSFYNPNFPSLMYGSFYPNDSIFLHRHLFNSTSPFYYVYWGVKLTVGINEVNAAEHFSVYPNPANGVLNIQTKKTTGKLSIKLFDVMGKTAYSTTVLVNNEQVVTINTTNFAKGVYFLLVEDDKNSTVKKVVVR